MEERKKIRLAFFRSLTSMMERHTMNVLVRITMKLGATPKLILMELELKESGELVVLVVQVSNALITGYVSVKSARHYFSINVSKAQKL